LLCENRAVRVRENINYQKENAFHRQLSSRYFAIHPIFRDSKDVVMVPLGWF